MHKFRICYYTERKLKKLFLKKLASNLLGPCLHPPPPFKTCTKQQGLACLLVIVVRPVSDLSVTYMVGSADLAAWAIVSREGSEARVGRVGMAAPSNIATALSAQERGQAQERHYEAC